MTNIISKISPIINPVCDPVALPASLGHDLLQPISILSLLHDQLCEEMESLHDDSDAARRTLVRMRRIICEQENMLNNLSWFMRLAEKSPDDKEYNMSMFPLFDAIDAAVDLVNHKVRYPTIDFSSDRFGDVHVYSNEHFLVKIIHLILENAFQFSLSQVTLWILVIGNGVRFSVMNDGGDIPKAIVGDLGMPFIKKSIPRPGQAKGLGLGIHLASKLSNMIGHRLIYSSSSENLCCFTLHMPSRPV